MSASADKSTAAYYGLAGRVIAIVCTDGALADHVAQLWQRVFQLQRLADVPAVEPVVQFQLSAQPGSAVNIEPPAAAPRRNLLLQQTPRGFLLMCGAAMLELDLERNAAAGNLPLSFWGQPLNQQRELFTFALFLLLRAHGLYGLHANALRDPAGRVVLVAGPSGSGKTTLMLNLLNAGWRCVGDDVLFAESTADGIVVHPLRRGVSCTAETLAHLSHLTLPADAPHLDRQKRLLPLPLSAQSTTGEGHQPQILLFPTIVEQPHSQVTALASSNALFLLLKLTVGMMLDTALAPHHLQTLSQLVLQTQAYQLHLGRDGLAQPTAVVELLESLLMHVCFCSDSDS